MASHSAIGYVGFHLNGDEENTKNSYAPIESYELFSAGGQPVHGGVYDLRLGTTDHNNLCNTCVQGKKLCPGHRGHLNLRVSVPQPIGIAEIRRWLRVICLKCGTLVIDMHKYKSLPAAKRLAEASTAGNEGNRCPNKACGAIHPKITKDKDDYFTFWAEPPGGEKRDRGARNRGADKRGDKLHPDHIRSIFQRITDETVELLGRSLDVHPRKLILKVINIPPNTIRPGVKSFSGGSSYHDSTNVLQNIVKRNMQLPEIGPGMIIEGDLDTSIQNMQQLYYDLIMGSSSTSVTQGNSGKRGLVVGARSVHSFMRNLPRKEGRIRSNLLGKRVFYISRTTISGNMKFRINEVGIPIAFARTLQVEEIVQEYNRDDLMIYFLNGRKQYPGCSHIVRRSTGETHDVSGLREFRLEIGDILYRDVINGDQAFFNRAPTLERSGVGVHKVVVIKDPGAFTFQMNVLSCEWYNADFDGDAMMLWVARKAGPRAEAMIMSSVSNQFISTKTSNPVPGQIQDSTVGCYELTRSGVQVDKYHAMGLFAGAGVETPRFDAEPANHIYSGRDIASLLFSQTPINYSRAPSSYSAVYSPYINYDPDEIHTVMEQGKLITGVLDKKSIGAKASGGLPHLISREYGPQKALDMVFALQQIALQFLQWRGFTVGTADLLPTSAAIEQIHAVASSTKLEAKLITDRLLRGEIVPPIDSTVHDFYERMQIAALKPPDSEVLRWVLGTVNPDTNGFFRMIAVGAKGDNPNLVQVSGVIGQTTINGDRIGETFAFRRTSPHFPRFAVDPAAHGFVTNSYMTGMTAPEFVCQSMNARFDLINKALTTASTGYFMRKGVMNNQSSIIDNFRHTSKDTKIVQFIYGEDGVDARELEKVSFRTVTLSDAELLAYATAGGSTAIEKEAVDRMRADRDFFREVSSRMETANFIQTFSTEMLLPVNVKRIVDGVFIAAKGTDAPKVSAAGLKSRIERVWDLCDRLPYALINEIQERKRSAVPAHKTAAASLLCMIVRSELTPKILAKLTDDQLTYIIDIIRHRYANSLIDYGSAVGILAAHCIAEPLTQYMLDSHHRSVGDGTNKNKMSRATEIYGARSVADEKTPSMLIPLRKELFHGVDSARAMIITQEVANSIEYVTVKRFTALYDVILEPYNALIYPPYASDAVWIKEFEAMHPLTQRASDLTNWCFRLSLDKSALVLKSVELELIVRCLRAHHPGIYVVHTPESSPNVVIRIWHRAIQFKKSDDTNRAQELLNEILDTPVRGIPGIMRAAADKVTRMVVNAEGAFVKEDRMVINTAGTNLYSALLNRAVDPTEIISNSIGDTYKMFGIEAARAKIISESRSFLEDNTPNLRHIFIYADEMTRTGKVTSIERAGLNAREHNNVLLRMSNAAPIEVVRDATLNNTKSRIYGIGAPLVLGAMPQIGTLYNEVVIDEKFVKSNTKSIDSFLDDL